MKKLSIILLLTGLAAPSGLFIVAAVPVQAQSPPPQYTYAALQSPNLFTLPNGFMSGLYVGPFTITQIDAIVGPPPGMMVLCTNCTVPSSPCTAGASQIIAIYLNGAWSCSSGSTGGAGTVTAFSSGNLPPLFTTSVSTATTTPAQTFTLSTAAANRLFANCTGSTATPAFCALTAAMEPSTTVNTNQSNTYAASTPQYFASNGSLADLVLVPFGGDPCCSAQAGSVWINTTGFNSHAHMNWFDGNFYWSNLTNGDTPCDMVNNCTGSGASVLAISPSLTTPNIGNATGISLTLALVTGDEMKLQPGLGNAVTGSLSSGTCSTGETMLQSTSGASSAFTEITPLGNLLLAGITGTADASHNWVGQTSGCVYAPTSVPGTPYIQNVPATGYILSGYGSDGRYQISNNGVAYSDVIVASDKLTAVYNHSGSQSIAAHAVTDTGTLSGGTLTVTFAGSAVFSSSTSYHCTANDATGTNIVRVTNTSGTVVVFTGTSTDSFGYNCIGN